MTPVTAISNFLSHTGKRAFPVRDDRFEMNLGDD